MSQLPLVLCGFCSCSERAATTPCQTDKRICFFSRCCKPTSFLCLKHFIWHGNTETTSGKVANFITKIFITPTKKFTVGNHDVWMYCETNEIYIYSSERDHTARQWTLYWVTSTIVHNSFFKFYFNIIPPYSTFWITSFRNICSICIPHSRQYSLDIFGGGGIKIMKLSNLHFSPCPFCLVPLTDE